MHIEEADIAQDNAPIYVEKELFRASKDVMDTLGNRDSFSFSNELPQNKAGFENSKDSDKRQTSMASKNTCLYSSRMA